MTRNCKPCKKYESIRKSNPIVYESWKASHICKINYQGSAPSMEPEGVKRIFGRSITKSKLRYTDFYGDGDSKSHPAVENIYKNKTVRKLECIGHIQKRVGNRCRKLKLRVKGLGGTGKLTNVMIDRLQNYFGIAVDLEGNSC